MGRTLDALDSTQYRRRLHYYVDHIDAALSDNKLRHLEHTELGLALLPQGSKSY